jgi:hypothetical protein
VAQKVEDRRTLTPWWVCDSIADLDTDVFTITGGLGSGKTTGTACLWVTEPGLMVREVFEKGQTRLRCPRAVVRQTILEGTPEGLTGKAAWWAELADTDSEGLIVLPSVDFSGGGIALRFIG